MNRWWAKFSKIRVTIKTTEPQHREVGSIVHRYISKCICGRSFTSMYRKTAITGLDDHIREFNIEGDR